ncbi:MULTISPECIES: glycosyltransferase family 4 protein [Allobacillus]|nr:glycosyltransferase family 4 protein [Allobacillus salarius]
MNILHLNTNFNQSSIYSNMFNSMNSFSSFSGRLYYPVQSNSKIIDDISEYVDVSKSLKKLDRFVYFYRNKKLYKDLQNIYDFKSYNLTLAYSLFSNGYLAYTVNKKVGIPYIVIVQNTDINVYFKKMFFLRGIGREILKGAHRVIFISQPYKEFVLNKYLSSKDKNLVENKSSIIPFGIDNFWFNNLAEKPKSVREDQIRLLYVGKINRNKNINSTIEVCKLLIKEGYKVKLTVVGEVQDKKIFKKILKVHFINYIPFVNKKNLIEIYRSNDIFIMPSIKESFGLVYAEAMSQGLPVIYTRGQGFDKHFKNGTVGYSVNCFNINEIAKKITLIISNYESISENCIKLVSKFKWSNIISEYELIIQEQSV